MQDLWTFAVACYAQPGIESLCLELQDAGTDVCLLLCGAWLEQRRIGCDARRLDDLQTIALHWQRQVVTPLREVRRAWKAAAQEDAELAELRQAIKTLELDAERVLLDRLEQKTQSWQAEPLASPWLEQLSASASQDSLARLRRAAVLAWQ